MSSEHDCTCPQRRRIDARQETNAEIWESSEWKQAKAEGIIENPRCFYCGDPTKVPHHDDYEVYGTPEYLKMVGVKWLCNQCHDGKHTGKFQCPVCKKITAKSDGEVCYGCLSSDDHKRIKQVNVDRNESRNKSNRKAYRACHPRKEVINGKWTVIKDSHESK